MSEPRDQRITGGVHLNTLKSIPRYLTMYLNLGPYSRLTRPCYHRSAKPCLTPVFGSPLLERTQLSPFLAGSPKPQFRQIVEAQDTRDALTGDTHLLGD